MKIKSWEDVDTALAEIAEHEENIMQAKATVDEAKGEIAKIEPAIEEYVREHEAELQERTLALVSGRVWLHRATHLDPMGRVSWKRILTEFIEYKRFNLISTKRTVDKEALKQLSDDRLKDLGVKRVTEDVFGYETA